MTLAIALVAASVLCHATWNLMAKKAGAAGTVFVAVWSAVAAVIWAPLGIWALAGAWDRLDGRALLFLGGALVLHSGYYMILQTGYRIGDLSVVYPIARGLGPVLTCLVAVPFFGEDPGLLGWAGTFLLAISVAVLGRPDLFAGRAAKQGPAGAAAAPTCGPRKKGITASRPVLYALLVGVFIAAYTLWDKQAVAVLPPILINWATDTGRAILCAPWLMRNRVAAKRVWRAHKAQIFGIALCSPAAYILVLTALTMAPVTVIAPLREVSVLLVVLLGAKLLDEGEMWRRLAASLGVVAGAVGVTLGR